MGLLNPGGPIAQFKRNRCSISPVELILQSGVRTQADEEREEREHEIYLEYPEYYEDEGILEEEEKWLEEFLNQLPEKKREYYKKLIKES